MSSQLLISVSPWDLRAALLEDGRLAELVLVDQEHQDPTGNIYKGRVLKVVPGLAAAFVDVGLESPAYLFAGDAGPGLEEFSPLGPCEDFGPEPAKSPRLSPGPSIVELLLPGQELLVQVSRPPSESKAARLTTQIALPGRFLVYLPTASHLAVSRRIASEGEQQRLKQLLTEIKPPQGGVIARTASAGRSREELLAELQDLVACWRKIRQKQARVAAPALLHQDLPMVRRLVRDLFFPDLEGILVDDPATYEDLCHYLRPTPGLGGPRVELHLGPEPLFSRFGVEVDWHRLLDRQVWLKSGGYLLIETTEALTAIDVNSGRYTKGPDLEDTLLKVNLEAAQEIARQVRLRNLGGLIVIDFIDLERPDHRKLVEQTLEAALARDRARTVVYPMSPLGLVEMTRQKLRESLMAAVTTPCPCCQGSGWVLSPRLVAHELLRQLSWEVKEFPGCRFTISAHPEVVAIVKAEGADLVRTIHQEGRSLISFVEDPSFARDRFDLTRELQ